VIEGANLTTRPRQYDGMTSIEEFMTRRDRNQSRSMSTHPTTAAGKALIFAAFLAVSLRRLAT